MRSPIGAPNLHAARRGRYVGVTRGPAGSTRRCDAGFCNGWGNQLPKDGFGTVIGTTPLYIRPGDTIWAVKQKDEDSNGCGCSSAGWVGTGSYYGGAGGAKNDKCKGFGGGWSGTVGNNVGKGNVSKNSFYFWVR